MELPAARRMQFIIIGKHFFNKTVSNCYNYMVNNNNIYQIWVESDWSDKEEFLDVIYWARQIIGILIGKFQPFLELDFYRISCFNTILAIFFRIRVFLLSNVGSVSVFFFLI